MSISLSGWYPGGAKPDGTLLSLQQIARRSYDKFMDYCLATDGMPAGMPAGAYRIKAPNQGFHPTFTLNATVSEGIGYGMLLTAWMGNPSLPDGVRVTNAQTIFDGLWTYYKHFRDANGLMNWHINPDGTVAATGGASDGDFDVAMALVVAHRIWGSNYGADATALINIIRDFEFTPTTYTGVGGPNVMMNGDLWGVDTDRYMPDYFRAGWFREFQKHTGDARWADIIAKNYPIALGYFWTNFTGGVVPDGCTRGSLALAAGEDAYTAGYNAVRWFGIAADLLYHPVAADVLSHDMSHRMITKAKTHWPLGGDVKAPVYDLNLAGPFETFFNGAGGGMFGMASLVDAAHTKYASEIAARLDADTELSYFNRGNAAIASVFMAGIAQVAEDLAPADATHGHAADATALGAQVHALVPDDAFHRHIADSSYLGPNELKPDDAFHAHTSSPVPGKPTSRISGRSTVTMVIREGGQVMLRPRDSGRLGIKVRAAGEVLMYVRAR